MCTASTPASSTRTTCSCPTTWCSRGRRSRALNRHPRPRSPSSRSRLTRRERTARMDEARDLIIEPIVSEKSYALLERNVYTFRVRPDATKPQIHDAVEQVFNVRVIKVNTLTRKGKRKRNRRTFTFGSRPTTKRAIVTLHPD